MTATVNIGLIGAGRIGKVHAQNLAYRVPGARLAGVADVDLEAARECAAAAGCALAISDYRVLLDDKNVQAVAVCTSTNTHAQIIEEAAAAGKHVFSEKPLDLDLRRIDQVLAAVKRAGVKLQVGFNRRFDSNFSRVREIVRSGKLGRPHLLRITSRDPQPPPIAYVKVSGGLFLDMTIHDLDMSRFLLGEEVTEIYAAAAVLVDPEIGKVGDVDTAVLTLRYQSGAIGTIDNSRRAVYGYDQRVEVFGEKGMVCVSNKKPDSAEWSLADGIHSSLPLFFFLERYNDSYIAEMRAFVTSIANDKDPLVQGIDGRIPVAMAYAAQKSVREQRPVKLSEVEAGAR